jgi:hypothetical protein
MVDASDSSFPILNSFKPSPRSSFKVSNIPLSKGQAMIGPVGNLHLGSPERGDISQMVTQPNALGPGLPQRLWKHSDCYNLQKVQMRVMGMVQVALLGTRRHRDETLWPIQLLPILLWFPRRWRSAWIRQSTDRSSHCWERQRRHYTIFMGGAAKGSNQRQVLKFVASRNCQQP